MINEIQIFKKMNIKLLSIPDNDVFKTDIVIRKKGVYQFNEKLYENELDFKILYYPDWDCHLLLDNNFKNFLNISCCIMYNTLTNHTFLFQAKYEPRWKHTLRVIGCTKHVTASGSMIDIDYQIRKKNSLYYANSFLIRFELL